MYLDINFIKLGWSYSLRSSICLLGMGRRGEKCTGTWIFWNGWDYSKTKNPFQDKIKAILLEFFNPVSDSLHQLQIASISNNHLLSRNRSHK